jgi:type I restriction enzyme R subunit
MNEAETRADHIDPALEAAGWGRVEGSRIRREYPITLGRIEGRGRLTLRFAYATNGQGIYGIDLVSGTEGELDRYPRPDELWNRTFAARNAWRDRFSEVQFPDKSGTWTIRYYQEIAVHRVLEALGDGKKRILLTLATGTGKTAIAFQIAWKLFQSRWTLGDWKQGGEPSRRPRILFLADRNNLADQAFNDFSSFSAFSDDALRRIDPDSIRRRGRVPTNGSIFFTIFQTFMGGPPKNGRPSPFFGEYPPDFFDFIIIDECHRGGANDEGTWRGIMEYFSPAVQLGLTATPKRRDNADTYAYFGKPVYVYMPDDTLIEGEIETGKRYEEPDFNKIVEIREREKKRVEIFMSHIDQGEKTLVFCATQDQALAVRDLVNQIKISPEPNYCQRVTANDGALGDQHLRDFQDNEKTVPTILTTSQRLSTGVDARSSRDIVLMRPINSMIEFKQIIGRCTMQNWIWASRPR